MLVELTFTSKNREIYGHIVIREKLLFKILENLLKDGFCFLRNESVSCRISPSELAQTKGLT